MTMNLAVCLLALSFLPLILLRGAWTMEIPEKDVETAKEMITSFVVVEGDKEYRWQKGKSGEPSDEGTLQETKAIEGDILKPPGMSTFEFNKRKVVEARNLWQNGVIPWTFNRAERQFTVPKAFTLVKEALHYMEKLTCLKFPQWSRQRSAQLGPNYLDIGQGSGCASYVGYYGKGPQPVLLNQKGCIKIGIIMHEICHSLGFYHEHSRTDRDKYINILFKNVKTSAHTNFKIHADSKNYALYDLESIMHYGPLAFSRGSEMTIKPKDENLAFLLGQRSQLSFYDIKTINDAYQCTRNCRRPHQRCRNGGFVDVTCKCHCPFGLKGVDCSSVFNNKVAFHSNYSDRQCPAVSKQRGSEIKNKKMGKMKICGGIITLTREKQRTNISFASKSIGKSKRIQCFWLIKAPLMTQTRLDLVDFHLKKAEALLCKQWLEIRYNVIGQQGPKYCGDLSGEIRSFESTTNLVMLSLDSSMIPIADAKFTMRVSLITKHDSDINCTFEMQNDMCIFHQVDNDDFDWILIHGPTPSRYTGPVGGNNGSARYLYIETSFPRRPGDAAILESRYLPAGNKCIAFHYNMYGKSVGQLTMKLTTENGHSLDVFQEKGSKGIDWKPYDFFLEAPLPFKIIIKATVGAGVSGDIAVDDISINTGMCYRTKQKTTLGKRIVTQIDCGFEEDACNFTWRPQSIAKVITSSLSGDASLIGSLLIFTWTLKDGEEAIIRSPVIPYHGVSCISVNYYVIGIAQWNLSLSVADTANNNFKILWSSSGMKEIKGRNNRITEEINESFEMIQIILTVMVPNNSSFVSLLAIDHIQLISSPCNKAQEIPWAEQCYVAADQSFGKGCLSFNFFARGILLKGIMLQKKMADGTSTVVWDSSKIMLMAVWSRIQIPLMGNGEFRLVFSTIEKDMFANYALDNMRLNPMPCTQD